MMMATKQAKINLPSQAVSKPDEIGITKLIESGVLQNPIQSRVYYSFGSTNHDNLIRTRIYFQR